MGIWPEDFTGDAFEPTKVVDLREGDVVRLRGRLWQVTSTLGFAFVARDPVAGETRHFGFGSATDLERRVGEPLSTDW